jgi:hypothetical protein
MHYREAAPLVCQNCRWQPKSLPVHIDRPDQGGGSWARQIGQPASALISIHRWRQCEWKKWLHGVSIRVDVRATCAGTVSAEKAMGAQQKHRTCHWQDVR